MNEHMRVLLVAVGLTLAGAACDRGKAEAERKAAEADKQAQEATITAAKVKAESEDAAKLKASHAEARTKLQQKFDGLERKSTYLKQKAVKAVGKEKLNASAAIAELDARKTTAKTSLGRLMDDTSPAWDTAKKGAEDDVDSFEKSVDALEHTLEKK